MEAVRFKNSFAQNIFRAKYAATHDETWDNRAYVIVEDVCGTRFGNKRPIMSEDERKRLTKYISEMKFLPGGRYIYYAGKQARYYNNCFLLRAEEDSREEWGSLSNRAVSCLMVGGGIGIDYSRLREKGRTLRRTGGHSSGPLSLMEMINEDGRRVMQGGSRRSAIYASLDREHGDAQAFLRSKNWHDMPISGAYTKDNKPMTVWDAKQEDFNYHAPLDMTNISLNYKDKWLNLPDRHKDSIFLENCKQACTTGEPGFSFNFGVHENETLRNACTELTSEDDSDCCNLGSVNLGNIDSKEELLDIITLASKFLICGTMRAELPYEKVYKVRENNRRIGLGLMGIHEWLLKRNYQYEINPELREWLEIYRDESVRAANEHCDRFFLSRPKGYRAIAPTGSIGILACTTTGIEPLFAVAYKRRYLLNGDQWHYEFVVDSTAQRLIDEYKIDPDTIETAYKLSNDPERRIKFQADVQDYVDHSISSTINLPPWGSEYNNEDTVGKFAEILSQYAPRIRGFTCYPDGSRGGQPLTEVPYSEAIKNKGTVYREHDLCSITSKGGVCGA